MPRTASCLRHALAVPVLFYRFQIYPELPAALLLLFAFRKLVLDTLPSSLGYVLSILPLLVLLAPAALTRQPCSCGSPIASPDPRGSASSTSSPFARAGASSPPRPTAARTAAPWELTLECLDGGAVERGHDLFRRFLRRQSRSGRLRRHRLPRPRSGSGKLGPNSPPPRSSSRRGTPTRDRDPRASP